MTWQNPKRINLGFAIRSEAHLTSFLKRHSRTLKRFNVWLTKSPDGWDEVFRTMKRELRLEEAEFKGIPGADGSDGLPKILPLHFFPSGAFVSFQTGFHT